MSQLSWLPPLNSHDNFYISVHASQGHPLVVDRRPPGTPSKFLNIGLEVSVIFHSDDIMSKKTFNGLSIIKEFEFPIISDSPSLENLISNVFFNNMYVPFQLDGAHYSETRISPMLLNSKETLATRDVLVKRISDFLKKLVGDPANTGYDKIRADLCIEKAIKLPNKELEAWIAWYEEHERDCPMFEDEYEDAISRPRSEYELLYEVVKGSYKSDDKPGEALLSWIKIENLNNLV